MCVSGVYEHRLDLVSKCYSHGVTLGAGTVSHDDRWRLNPVDQITKSFPSGSLHPGPPPSCYLLCLCASEEQGNIILHSLVSLRESGPSRRGMSCGDRGPRPRRRRRPLIRRPDPSDSTPMTVWAVHTGVRNRSVTDMKMGKNRGHGRRSTTDS